MWFKKILWGWKHRVSRLLTLPAGATKLNWPEILRSVTSGCTFLWPPAVCNSSILWLLFLCKTSVLYLLSNSIGPLVLQDYVRVKTITYWPLVVHQHFHSSAFCLYLLPILPPFRRVFVGVCLVGGLSITAASSIYTFGTYFVHHALKSLVR